MRASRSGRMKLYYMRASRSSRTKLYYMRASSSSRTKLYYMRASRSSRMKLYYMRAGQNSWGPDETLLQPDNKKSNHAPSNPLWNFGTRKLVLIIDLNKILLNHFQSLKNYFKQLMQSCHRYILMTSLLGSYVEIYLYTHMHLYNSEQFMTYPCWFFFKRLDC